MFDLMVKAPAALENCAKAVCCAKLLAIFFRRQVPGQLFITALREVNNAESAKVKEFAKRGEAYQPCYAHTLKQPGVTRKVSIEVCLASVARAYKTLVFDKVLSSEGWHAWRHLQTKADIKDIISKVTLCVCFILITRESLTCCVLCRCWQSVPIRTRAWTQ